MSNALFAAEHHETAAPAAVHLVNSTHHLPPVWLAAPFIILILMIAAGPLFYHRFWENHYSKLSLALGALVATYYGLAMDGGGRILWQALEEYLSFMALLTALFVSAGGIFIRIERRGGPIMNGALLLFGAIFANLIGTTGASMLLIRPYMRINEGRIKPFHIVFFIFMVSNIGGALTPIGDPPLFLGFLKGVPFFWPLSKLWLPWLITIAALLLVFMVLDRRVGRGEKQPPQNEGGAVRIEGARSFIFLALVIGTVFLDPSVIPGFPALQDMLHLPFGIREVTLFSVAVLAYKTADSGALKGNGFNFSPVIEVAFLFIGIFFTMIPALELIAAYAAAHAAEFSVTRLYWMTGILSGLLDNAPTYLNFLAGAAGKFGVNIGLVSDMKAFAGGLPSPVSGDVTSTLYLMAISLASVFFGAMTYIGNAPNFMVRNIAAQADVEVPGFMEYMYKYSIPLLLPCFALVWFLFFNY